MRRSRFGYPALIALLLLIPWGPLPAARAPGQSGESYRHLSPAELKAMLGREDFVFVQGYTNVSHLEGGMIAWRKAGYPLRDHPGAN